MNGKESHNKDNSLLENSVALGVGTKLISLKPKPLDYPSKPVITPIYVSSTYFVKSCDEYGKQMKDGIVYSRFGTPNSMEVEEVLANLEGGAGALVFAGGMIAVSSTIMCFLRPGDHLVTQSPLYSGTHFIIKEYLSSYGIEVSAVKVGDDIYSAFKAATKKNTKLYLAETPCNPTMSLCDLDMLAKLGKEMGIITAVDSTFASPINQLPIKHGIDIVIHSCTKYMGGHSDMLAGCTIFKSREHYTKMFQYRSYFTSPLDAANCSLLLRSLRTLHIRVKLHNENAMIVAQFLEKHQKVKRVLYPGLPSHPQHELAKAMMMGFGGMMTIILHSEAAAKTLVENTQIFHFAVSLGGVESLIEHVTTMTHGDWAMNNEERAALGIDKGMVRLSIGLEDPKDLIDDLQRALEHC